MKILISGFVLLFLMSSCGKDPHRRDYGVVAKHAMVVTAHTEATRIALDVLREGGNAVDAAAAAEFALAVCFPAAGNLGGGGFMVVRLSDGTIDALDYREKAPQLADQDMFLDEHGTAVADLSIFGYKAAGVPGTVDGLLRIHRKYGRLPWKNIVQPSINLSRQGFRISLIQAISLNDTREDFLKYNSVRPPYVKDSLWKENDILILPDLAHTLELIRDFGRDGFYSGEVAGKIVEEMRKNGGLIRQADLDNYSSVFRTPVTAGYKDYRIISMPPPSSGGIALIQLLKIIEPFPIQQWGFHSAGTIHLIVEAERSVYADRAKYLGDPGFFPVPVRELLDSAYLRKRMCHFNPSVAGKSSEITAGYIPGYESEETTHYSIIDEDGNAVAGTTTLNQSFGSKIIIAGTGIILNDQMDDFSVKPGTPNSYGLIGGKANAIQPGKRMLSAMTPTIVEKKGNLFMVVGSPGGATIITSVMQTILNVIEYGMSMQEAVSASRFHHQWLPDVIYYENNGLDSLILSDLEAMGYHLQQRESFGRVDAILVTSDGSLEGGADPRGDDTAMGY